MTYANRGSMSAIGIVFPVLSILSLAIRAYGSLASRAYDSRGHRRKLGIDDILIIPAGVSQARDSRTSVFPLL